MIACTFSASSVRPSSLIICTAVCQVSTFASECISKNSRVTGLNREVIQDKASFILSCANFSFCASRPSGDDIPEIWNESNFALGSFSISESLLLSFAISFALLGFLSSILDFPTAKVKCTSPLSFRNCNSGFGQYFLSVISRHTTLYSKKRIGFTNPRAI